MSKELAEQMKAPLTEAAKTTGISRTTMILLGIHAGITTGLMVLQFSGSTKLKGVTKALQIADAAIMQYVANPDA